MGVTLDARKVDTREIYRAPGVSGKRRLPLAPVERPPGHRPVGLVVIDPRGCSGRADLAVVPPPR